MSKITGELNTVDTTLKIDGDSVKTTLSGLTLDMNTKKEILNSNWTTGSMPNSNSWRESIFGNNLFVAVSQNGDAGERIAYSSDCINWSYANYPTEISFHGVAFGNGIFIAVSTEGNAILSKNGVDWIDINIPSGYSFRGIDFANDRFFACSTVSGSNSIISSYDGYEWTILSLPVSNGFWRSVAWGAGKYVACEYHTGKIIYSNDGTNWSIATTPAESLWIDIIYANGLFVTVAYSGTRRLMTSPDGVNWTSQTIPSESFLYRSVGYAEGYYYAGHDTGLIKSKDGLTWEIVDNLTITGSRYSISYGNGRLIIVTSTSGNYAYTGELLSNQNILTSTDNAFYGFSAYKSGGDQTIANSNDTIITFATENFDPQSDYSTTTNRYTPSKSGKYKVNLVVRVNDTNSGGGEIYIKLNGTIVSRDTIMAGVSKQYKCSKIIEMNGTTDYVEGYIKFNSASGGSIIQFNSQTYFESNYLGY